MVALLDKRKSKVIEIFNYLHENPEISWKEYNTTKFVKNLLEQYGCKATTFDDCTGVVGEIGEGSPVIGIRADIDALWQEVDGKFRGNHSCGHDAHMSIVLGVLIALSDMNYSPKGKIKFIFQPAEEKGQGALKMVEKGIADDLDYLFGVHLRPIQETENGRATPAIIHGATGTIQGEIIGEDAHGARPHLGINSIEVGATLVQEMSLIHIDPMIPHSVKMTKFQAGGESDNIIPGHAHFSIDLRAQTNDAIKLLISKVEKAAKTVAGYYGAKINLKVSSSVAAAKVHPKAQELLERSIIKTLGINKLDAPLLTTGGDDFHFYTLKRPEIKASMLGVGCDLKPGLHHPNMTFDREALFNGIDILTNVIKDTFEQKKLG